MALRIQSKHQCNQALGPMMVLAQGVERAALRNGPFGESALEMLYHRALLCSSFEGLKRPHHKVSTPAFAFALAAEPRSG